AFVPITFAVDGVKVEAGAFGGGVPIVTFGTDDALHRSLLAAATVVAVTAVPMAVTVNALRGDAEAAIGGAAIGPAPVGAGHQDLVTSAIGRSHPSQRHGAGRGASHHCQHDAARAFHGAILPEVDRTGTVLVKPRHLASESRLSHGKLRLNRRRRRVTRSCGRTR